jgi:hypothetical protein
MRKQAAILAALVVFIVDASADITWSAWGRGVVAPLSISGGDSSVSAATTTSGDKPRVGFSALGTAESGNIGFVADMAYDGGSAGVGDNAKVWVKPFPVLKITAGWFNEDDLRGTVGNSEFTSWLLPNGGKDEDNIFNRFQATAGAHFVLKPLDGLMIEAAIGSNSGASRANRNLFDNSAWDVYKAIQAGIGYKIPDIGFARAQFIGNNRAELKANEINVIEGQRLMTGLTHNSDADVIEAAFRYEGISGVIVDCGAKIPLQYRTDAAFQVYPALNPNAPVLNSDGVEMKVQQPYSIALGATYSPAALEAFNILVRFDGSLGGWAEEPGTYRLTYGNTYQLWVNPSYQISDTVKTGIDFGMEIHEKDVWEEPIGTVLSKPTKGSDYVDKGVGAWVELQVGGGTVKTGVLVMLPGSERWAYDSSNSTIPFSVLFSGDPVITIPISFTYSF